MREIFSLFALGAKLFVLYIGILTVVIGFAMNGTDNQKHAKLDVIEEKKDEKPCSYGVNISSTTSHTIQKIKNVKFNTVGYYKDVNQCIATFDAKIDGRWYIAEGSYIYGPDISESQACKQAKQKAKVNIISQVSPEYVSSETIYECKG